MPCNYGAMISLPNTHTTVQDPTPNTVRNPWILFITDNVKCAGKVDMHAWAQTLGCLCLPCSRGGSRAARPFPPAGTASLLCSHAWHACMHAHELPSRQGIGERWWTLLFLERELALTKELPCHAGWNTNLTSVKNQWKETRSQHSTSDSGDVS